MNLNDFEKLTNLCQITYNQEEDSILFKAFNPQNSKLVEDILKNNNCENLSMEEFQKITSKLVPIMQAKEKLRNKNFNDFVNMSSIDVAQLPIEKKLDYLDTILFNQPKDNFIKLCSMAENNMKACFFNMDFPKTFWDDEDKKMELFVKNLEKVPNIKEDLKKWDNLDIEKRKNIIQNTMKAFCKSYGIEIIDVSFFTAEEYRSEMKNNNINVGTHVPSALTRMKQRNISFNEERLATAGNLFGIELAFHECLHIYQKEEKFNDSVVERMLSPNMNMTTVYEFETNKNNHKNIEYRDFYTMVPAEAHAYQMQYKLENHILDKWGIEKTENKFDINENIESIKITEKAKAFADYKTYQRTNNKG